MQQKLTICGKVEETIHTAYTIETLN